MDGQALLARAKQDHAQGLTASARNCCLEVVRASKSPQELVEAFEQLGTLALQSQQAQEATDWLTQALALDASRIEARVHLGLALKMAGQLQEAISQFERACEMDPTHAAAHYNAGNAWAAAGNWGRALQAFDRVIALQPGFAAAHFNRGKLLEWQGLDQEALAAFNQAVACAPNDHAILFSQACALQALGQHTAALNAYNQLLERDPTLAAVWNNKAQLLQRMRQPDQALACLRTLFALAPDFPYVRGELAFLCMRACDWKSLDPHLQAIEQGLRQGLEVAPCLPVIALTDSASLQKAAAQRWVASTLRVQPRTTVMRPQAGDGRIRVGYFSADFRQHPVSWLWAEVPALHDRQHFEIWAFKLNRDPDDDLTRRIAASVDHWIDCGAWADPQILAFARQHLDIAVDLSGHTEGCRATLFAQRLAPVQVQHLGYPGTWGSDAIDYIVADRCVIPPPSRTHYSERVAYLPCFQFNDRQREIAPAPPARSAAGLPEKGVVFCCLNNSFKIQPAQFEQWMQLLEALPDAVLWLYAPNASVSVNLRRACEARGVDPDRLVFAAKLDSPTYLARYALADVFLDTFPFNAGTTASDALRMGVPVITRCGEAFASRMAASLLGAVGLDDLVCDSAEGYLALALRAGRDPEWLASLKARLQKGLEKVTWLDTPRMTRHLERLFLQMHQRASAGLPPEHLDSDTLEES